MCDDESLVVLQDEDGNDVEFEFLDLIALDGNEYVVLLPIEEVEQHEVFILRLAEIEEDGCETYASVDDAELMRVFGVFKQRFKDDFEWVD